MSVGRKCQRGSTMAETAIVMTTLLAMICGIIDFGRALYTYSFVAQTARQATRWAMVRGSQCTLLTDCNATQSQVQAYAQSLAYGFITPSSMTARTTWVSCPPGSSGNAPGCTVDVVVTYPFHFALPWTSSLGSMTMTGTSEMVISQ
jgi:Flp pilus assembly protein TadG